MNMELIDAIAQLHCTQDNPEENLNSKLENDLEFRKTFSSEGKLFSHKEMEKYDTERFANLSYEYFAVDGEYLLHYWEK